MPFGVVGASARGPVHVAVAPADAVLEQVGGRGDDSRVGRSRTVRGVSRGHFADARGWVLAASVHTKMLSLFFWPHAPPASPQTYASKTASIGQ